MFINYVLELIHWIKKYIRKNNLFYNHTKTNKKVSYLKVVMYLSIGLANHPKHAIYSAFFGHIV